MILASVKVIGVIDLLGGRAVRAVAGARERYQPVQPIAGVFTRPGDAQALARFYIERVGVDAIYVADLDAIQGGALQFALISSLCKLATAIYVDAGVTTVDAARRVLTAGAGRIIVGLETLASFDDLAAICAALGGDRVVFSLDFRGGRALSNAALGDDTPEALTMRALRAGVQSLIVIDLARVGVGAGLDLEVIGRVRTAAPPHVTVMAGGGVRDWSDLERVAAAGCDAVLIASALQNGVLDAQDVKRARDL
jgi:phosphoribosylformimino-5-aminoimidazole carboxamide ribotide isomerase